MRICAVVLNYRDAIRTGECLRSLVGQGLEVALVVDNSADQEAAAALATMLPRLEVELDYPVRLIETGCNIGFARGVNLALNDESVSHCDAFLLINNDAVALPGMVQKLAAALAGGNDPMVAPTILDDRGVPQPMLWYQRFFGLLTARPLPGSFPYLSGCCLLVRHEMLEQGRLFDEDFFMYGEDTLLGWRLACAGKKPLRLDDAQVRHARAGNARHGGIFYEYHMARAHLLLVLKNARYPLEIPLLLACKSAGLAARALWRSLRFGTLVPLHAFLLAWRKREIGAD